MTCKIAITLSTPRSDLSIAGQPALAIAGLWPSFSHISSAVYGATSDRQIAIASADSRTAGSCGPQPESIAFLVAFTNSIILAITTLNLKDSTANSISESALWITLRSSIFPLFTSTPGLLVTSWLMRQARFKNFNDPAGETSDQSISSSGGAAKTIDTRIASTPCLSSSSDNLTRLPRLLLMAEPSIKTIP